MKIFIIFFTLLISATVFAGDQSREQAIAEGIKPSIYTHPIGYHGYGAGAVIVRWGTQKGELL